MITVSVSADKKIVYQGETVVYTINILNKAPYTKAQNIVLVGFVPGTMDVIIMGEEAFLPIALSKAGGGTKVTIDLSQAAKQMISVRLTMMLQLKEGKKEESFSNRFALKEDGKLSFVIQAESIHFVNKEVLEHKE